MSNSMHTFALGFCLSHFRLQIMVQCLVIYQNTWDKHIAIKSLYLWSFGQLAGIHFHPELKTCTHDPKCFFLCGAVRQRPHLTLPSFTSENSKRMDSDWVKPMSHPYSNKQCCPLWSRSGKMQIAWFEKKRSTHSHPKGKSFAIMHSYFVARKTLTNVLWSLS